MDNRKNEIKGIVTETFAAFIYILVLLALAVVMMR
jgi:hypothetical protein